jgi:catalase
LVHGYSAPVVVFHPNLQEGRMPPAFKIHNADLARQLIDALDVLSSGEQPGFRPAHPKGAMCSGTFTPSPEAASLTRAPHASRPSTPVTVRYSNSSGIPAIPDNDPHSVPKGFAIRFHLGEHEHTDIIGHAFDGFPVRTGEEFAEFLRAVAADGAGQKEPLQSFMGAHPKALQFATTPKPFPASFAREAFFAVNAFKFTNAEGVSRFGRFRIRPELGTEYLSDADAAAKSANFLFDELNQRLAKGPLRMNVSVQIAEAGDVVDDSTVAWPSSRKEIPFGTITVTARVDDQAPQYRKVIFDPEPKVTGIDKSGDPLTEARADVYLMSGRRRRKHFGDDKH